MKKVQSIIGFIDYYSIPDPWFHRLKLILAIFTVIQLFQPTKAKAAPKAMKTKATEKKE